MACRIVLSAAQGAMASDAWARTIAPKAGRVTPRMWHATRSLERRLWRVRTHGGRATSDGGPQG
eukprot:6585961-Prymnesium_polylepis.1